MLSVVTGVAGFVGSHLAEKLLAAGHHVRGVDCFTDYYARERKERNLEAFRRDARFELLETDLGSADLAPIVDGASFVFHQSAQAGVRASWGREFEAYTHHNVLATQRLLEAVKGGPIEKVVYASSSSVYGDTDDLPMRETSLPKPYSPYGVTKLAAEHLCELYRNNFGVPTVSLRYFTVYGPRQRPDMAFHRWIASLRAGKHPGVFGDGEQTRDFTYVDDIVDANMSAARSDKTGVYNLGGGSRVTVNHVLETLAELTGTPVTKDTQPKVAGDVRHTYADTSRAQRELGFAPKTALRQGLEKEIAWYDAELADGAWLFRP